ncbi:hypothetical protein, partial [Gemmiger sp.]|uniref:hypothetical protein n=1 Tax=Gemmiger sp. TaxID=2049027 RepID=UPI003AF5965A
SLTSHGFCSKNRHIYAVTQKRCQPGCMPGWHLCLTELSIVYTFSVQIATKNEKYFIAKA